MARNNIALAAAIKQAVRLLAEQQSSQLAVTIAPIIFSNLERGRVQSYLNEKPQRQPIDYIWRVADHYYRWHDYVAQVQLEQQADVWSSLFVKLQRWAYNYLRRSNFPAVVVRGQRSEHALNCASEAGVAVVNAHFPYDVDFDPWACVLLKNTCRKYISRRLNPTSLAETEVVHLDAWDGWLWNLIDPDSLQAQLRVELRHDLLDAVEQLSSNARRQFIRLYYFEHLSFSEIAAKMDSRNVNALYKLHADALKNLRSILSD